MQPIPVYGSISVSNSITNLSTEEDRWLDFSEPFTFNAFVKQVENIGTPQQYNNAYKDYLEAWYVHKGESKEAVILNVKNQYIDLLRNIALNYTTLEEKRFLSNIDYDSEEDLAIAIPFFSLKLSDICEFYIEKREKLKTRTASVKSKGTTQESTQRIFDTIYDYVFVEYGYNNYNLLNTSLSAIIQDLDIEIEELYDTYSEYFDISADSNASDYNATGRRAAYWSSNTNVFELDLFTDFEESLKRDIFKKPIIIDNIDLFKVNYSPSLVDLICTPSNTLEQTIRDGKPNSEYRLDIRKKILSKYLGTDIYFLSTNSTLTDFTSGILAEAESPAKNYSNKRFPSTATIPEGSRKSARELGLFFKPDKLGKLTFKTAIENFSIKDIGQLEPDNIYIFPDPNLYGNVSNFTEDTLKNYPLEFFINESKLKKSAGHGFSVNDVFSTPYDTLAYSYNSNENTQNNQNTVFTPLFTKLYNSGILANLKHDLYGNQFGLIKKSTGRRSIESASLLINSAKDKDRILFDGHVFYDDIEGYNFNYSLSSDDLYLGYATRTGLTARTIEEVPYGSGNYSTGYNYLSTHMFNLTGDDISSLYFREFCPYIETTYNESLYYLLEKSVIYDGGGFRGVDEMSADDIRFNKEHDNAEVYYSILIEAGINPNNSNISSPIDEASFTAAPILSSNNFFIIDGKSFGLDILYRGETLYTNDIYPRSDEEIPHSTTIFDNSSEAAIDKSLSYIQQLSGNVFVHNFKTNTILPLSAALSGVFSSYDSIVRDSIYDGDITYFDILYNTIIIETTNDFIVQDFKFADNQFKSSIGISDNFVYNVPLSDPFKWVSNPFYVNSYNKLYFCTTSLLSTLSSSNSKSVFPEIYAYDISGNKVKKIYPVGDDYNKLSSLFSLSAIGINITNITKPSLTHNSRNNIFSLTWAGNDGNYQSTFFNMRFNHKDNDKSINIQSIRAYPMSQNGYSYNFFDSMSASLLSGSELNTDPIHSKDTGEYKFN